MTTAPTATSRGAQIPSTVTMFCKPANLEFYKDCSYFDRCADPENFDCACFPSSGTTNGGPTASDVRAQVTVTTHCNPTFNF
jgi:hypothetical protein